MLGIDENKTRVVVQYLSGEKLLDITTHGFNVLSYLDASLYIKHKGVMEVE